MTETTITRLGSQKFGQAEPIQLPERVQRKPALRERAEPRETGIPETVTANKFNPFRDEAAALKQAIKARKESQTDAEPAAQSDLAPTQRSPFKTEQTSPVEAEFEPVPASSTALVQQPDAMPHVETETLPEEPPLFDWKEEAKPEPRFSLRARIAALFAVIALPAMAAPGDFGAEPGAAPTAEEMEAALALSTQPSMPFERAGMSFPGSAFFYLADPPKDALVALPNSDPLTDGAIDGLELGEYIDAGPAANGFFLAGDSLSKGRAQQCLAQAVWYEAASESNAGQRAVAQVVLNRVKHPSWPNSVCGVVYQGSQRRTGCQFSFTCDGSLARRPSGGSWSNAQLVASSALSGEVYAPIGMATHYHTLWVNPYWANSLATVGTIGAHIFYRNRGAAGEKSAFTGRYSGSEPKVRGRKTAPPAGTPRGSVSAPLPNFSSAPAPRAQTPSGSATPTRSTRRSGTSGRSTAQPEAPTSSPISNPELRNAGQVKDKYSNAGQWKKRPGSDSESSEKSGN